MARIAGSPGRGAVHRDWTKGSIVRNLLSLGWPVIITNSLNLLGPFVDMIWVGKLGAVSVAGVGVAGVVVQVVNPMQMGISTGSRAMVARRMGSGDTGGAGQAARQAFIVSAAFGFMMALVGIFLAGHILRAFGVAADVAVQGASYLRIALAGMLVMSMVGLSTNVMQASGDTISPLKIAVAARLFHVAFAPFMIFGWWIFPRLGVSGAALTSVVSTGLGGSLGMWFLLSGRTRLRLSFRPFNLDPRLMWRIVRIGIPAAINSTQIGLVSLVMTGFIVPFGTVAVAAHTITERMQAMVTLPCMGLAQATGVLVGQNLGARQPERAARSGWLGVLMVEAFAVVLVLVMQLFPEAIVRVFNSEPDVVATGAGFIRIAAVAYVFMGVNMVLMEACNGAGDTLMPMIVGLTTTWGVRIPLAFLLPQVAGLGVYGVRWAIVAGSVVAAATYAVYFWRGRWKRKRV